MDIDYPIRLIILQIVEWTLQITLNTLYCVVVVNRFNYWDAIHKLFKLKTFRYSITI